MKILRQPYPFEQKEPWKILRNGMLQGVFIAAFLIVFQPFQINLWDHPQKNLMLCGFGIITALAYYLVSFIPPLFIPKHYHSSHWTVGKEILHICILLILIAFGNMLYTHVLFELKLNFKNFLFNLTGVALLGFFPVVASVFFNYIYQLKKYGSPLSIKEHISQEKTLRFVAENEKDSLTIKEWQLLFIENADNYAVIHFLTEEQELKKEILRSSLSRLEEQAMSNEVIRTHRSYIVNLAHVEKVSGNAQGYKLHLKTGDFTVPVARKYSQIVKTKL